MNFSYLIKLLLAALFTSAISANSVMASDISDGSSGEFHPLFDALLDFPTQLISLSSAIFISMLESLSLY